MSEEKQENTINLRQNQRWSLMTVLYLIVRTSFIQWRGWSIVLIPKCSRYAILEYHFLCMFLQLTSWCLTNSPSVVISVSSLRMSYVFYI
jgi:hypothetical protein